MEFNSGIGNRPWGTRLTFAHKQRRPRGKLTDRRERIRLSKANGKPLAGSVQRLVQEGDHVLMFDSANRRLRLPLANGQYYRWKPQKETKRTKESSFVAFVSFCDRSRKCSGCFLEQNQLEQRAQLTRLWDCAGGRGRA